MNSKIKIFSIFLVLILFTSCHSVELEKVENVRLTRQGIKLDLEIKNPFPLAVTLSDFKMNVTVDRFNFSDVVYEPQIKLKPFSEKYYTVNVDMHPFQDLRSSTGAFLAMVSQDSTKLTLDGKTKVKILFLHSNVKFHKELYFKYRKK